MSQRAAELARQFEQAVADFARTVEGCSDAQWAAACKAEGWSVAQTAQHVSGQFPLEMEFITAGADGKSLPTYTWDDINGKNDSRAAKNGSVSKADVLKELRAGASSTAAYIRALSDEQLDRTGALPLAGGASVSTQQLIEGGVLIGHVTGHLESINTAG
ncbi:MAG: DinB family protein [Chloroflexi bacterium]|nr:DinB family protein [Chloroflexota bacterium]